MTAYYNEIDPQKAAWLRELMKRGLIAPGDVDERSIADVFPADLAGYTQCHFFAGCGVWSYALRLAGWPDDRPAWTGSCPCQPFSAAGKGGGTSDERHLWPDFHYLIRCGRPPVVLGEQVSSPAGLGWWDVVSADVEAENYARWAVDFSSAGVGAPIIRQRLYWVACSESTRGRAGLRDSGQAGVRRVLIGDGSGTGRLERSSCDGRGQISQDVGRGDEGTGAQGRAAGLAVRGGVGRPGLSCGEGLAGRQSQPGDDGPQLPPAERAGGSVGWSNATAGFWRDPDWLGCRDGKWRPVRPGTFPLAHGAPVRVGRLRGYGDAINAQAAKAFIEAVMEVL